MKKENIFDLYAAQHKDEPAPAAERVPGEVKPEDMAPPQEVPAQAPEPETKQEPTPDQPQDPEPEPKQEGGNNNGV